MLRRALLSATVASLLSTWVVSRAARDRTGSASAGTNATSHWVWDDRAGRVKRTDWKHTGVGYLIHHASSFFWAIFHETWRDRRPRTPPLASAATVATVAYVVDYHVVPRRLTPGFERHLSGRAMFATYAAFGAGLLLVAMMRRR